MGALGVSAEGNGLDYMMNRYYNVSDGRFISDDPLGIQAGDPNIYRYAFNSPTILVDPSGLRPGPVGLGLGLQQCNARRRPSVELSGWSPAHTSGPVSERPLGAAFGTEVGAAVGAVIGSVRPRGGNARGGDPGRVYREGSR